MTLLAIGVAVFGAGLGPVGASALAIAEELVRPNTLDHAFDHVDDDRSDDAA